jgi:acyl-CoA reductase-like NAD-dependent aldehyde dehydrogenase
MSELRAPETEIETVPLLVAGRWVATDRRAASIDPYSLTQVGSVCESTDDLLLAALEAAARAAPRIAATPSRERAALLRRAASRIREQSSMLARTMALETGKPVRDATTEVLRSAETLELSGEEGMRIEGAQVPMETSAIGAGKLGVSLRFPVGVVAAITPFNAPVNLTAHKLGPAWAAGNSVVLKPSPASALTIHRFVEVLLDAGIPPDWLQLVQGDEAAARMVGASQVDFVSFTGSSRVGAIVKATSGLKRVALELGGNGFTIVEADANLEEAAIACARNGMRLAGQSCISVQTVCVQRSVYAAFVERLGFHVGQLRVGNPLDEATDVGPVISLHAAARIEALVDAALEAGARRVCGGPRHGALLQPTVLADVPAGCALVRDEVFGPVVGVMAYDDIQAVFDLINAGPFGLQAGIYTHSLPVAMRAMRSLRMGAVIVNGSCTWRSDQAPYGGVKASGIGREGPRFAIREMTEERFVLFNA